MEFCWGGLGTGALVGTWYLPRFKQATSLENLITAGTMAFSAATIGTAVWRQVPVLFCFLFLGGIGWLILLASLNAITRIGAPSWIEARALALYLMAFQGSIALGSLIWGAVASRLGSAYTLVVASAILIVTIAARARYPLQSGEHLDLRPAKSWPEPNMAFKPNSRRGPVLVIAEYRVHPDRIDAFLQIMRSLRAARLRTGAFQWGLFADSADPVRHIEEFMIESWVEHLRQHERFTVEDGDVQQTILAFLDEPPHISHYVAATAVAGDGAGRKLVRPAKTTVSV